VVGVWSGCRVGWMAWSVEWVTGFFQDILGVKKVSAPLEKSLEMPPLYFCPREKIISRTFRISGTLIVIIQTGIVNLHNFT
jgi:hypothetical protein